MHLLQDRTFILTARGLICRNCVSGPRAGKADNYWYAVPAIRTRSTSLALLVNQGAVCFLELQQSPLC